MLEIAYWIGPVPGGYDSNPDLLAYEDTRTTGRAFPQYHDRWVVFHFHFDHTRQIFIDIDGHTHAGFVSFPNR